MTTTKKTASSYRFWWIGLLVFISIGAGIWYWKSYYAKKSVFSTVKKVHQPPRYRWIESEENNQIIKPYTASIHGNEQHVCKTVYNIKAGDPIRYKRITTKKDASGKPISQVTDYFFLRKLFKEDANAVHNLVRQSGKTYFGSEPTFKLYGSSVEQAEQTIMNHNLNNHDTKGIFYSENGQKDYRLIGIVGLQNHPDMPDGTKNGFYAIGNPKITDVHGAATPSMYGYLSYCFYIDSKLNHIILAVHDQNHKSHRVAKKLQGKPQPKSQNQISYGPNHKRKDMTMYQVRREFFF